MRHKIVVRARMEKQKSNWHQVKANYRCTRCKWTVRAHTQLSKNQPIPIEKTYIAQVTKPFTSQWNFITVIITWIHRIERRIYFDGMIWQLNRYRRKVISKYEQIFCPNLYLWKIDRYITNNEVLICDAESH